MAVVVLTFGGSGVFCFKSSLGFHLLLVISCRVFLTPMLLRSGLSMMDPCSDDFDQLRGERSDGNEDGETSSDSTMKQLVAQNDKMQGVLSRLARVVDGLADARDEAVYNEVMKRRHDGGNMSNNNDPTDDDECEYSGKKFTWRSFPDVEKFSGLDEAIRFEDWLKRFELLCQVNGCTRKVDKAKTLLLALKEEASYFIMGEPDVANLEYDVLKEKLVTRFGANRNWAADKRTLLNRRKLKDESWQHLADDISRLAGRVYAGAPIVVAREAKDAFIRALPESMRYSIAATDPVSVADCVARVTQMCSIMNIDERSSGFGLKKPGPMSVNYAKNKGTSSNTSESQTADGTQRWLPKEEWLKSVTCWNCGEKGHLKWRCPNPPKEKQENGKESQ